MKFIPPGTKVYVATSSVDMRRGFEGLSFLVRQSFGCDPLDGSLYVFINRQRDYLKVLSFDGDGQWLWSKRLEKGTFGKKGLFCEGKSHIELSTAELLMLLEGFEFRDVRRRPRYSAESDRTRNFGMT